MTTDHKQNKFRLNQLDAGNRPRLSRPVFWAGHVYAFGDGTSPVNVHRFKVGVEGVVPSIEYIDKSGGIRRKATGPSYLASCVFKDKIFVFYDWDIGGHRYSIRYKTSAHPEKGLWDGRDPKHADDEEAGYDTGFVGQYPNWFGVNAVASLHATVFHGKIYVFSMTADETIRFVTFDGTNWAAGGQIRGKHGAGKLLPHYAVTPVMRRRTAQAKPTPQIAVCSQEVDDRSKAVFSFIQADNTVEYGVLVNDYSRPWVANNDHLALVAGSIRDGFQARALQVFFTTSHAANWSQLLRMEINLDTNDMSPWVDTGIQIVGDNFHRLFDVIAAPVAESDGISFRHYLTVMTAIRLKPHFIACYPSDRFVRTHEKTKVLVDSEQDVGAWLLLGVIEGAPPFSRNGEPPSGPTSELQYGHSEMEAITVTSTFATSIGAMFGSAVDGSHDVSVELTASFSLLNKMSHTVTNDVRFPFQNVGDNVDGAEGYFIVAHPYVSNRNYQRLSYDSRVELGTFHVTWIDKNDLTYERYRLAEPLPGMHRRGPSSNVGYWSDVKQFPEYETYRVRELNSMRAVAGAPAMRVGLQIDRVSETHVEGSTSLEFKSKFTIQELFKVGASARFSYTSRQVLASKITRSIQASVSLPTGSRQYGEIRVLPAWYLPKDGATLPERGEQRPGWIPDRYFRARIAPWCITWRVLG
jgi:hypothetical protein